MEVRIAKDGSVQMVHTDLLPRLYSSAERIYKRRASHVEPKLWILKINFRLLRKIFGSSGKIANWTRSWSCLWMVDLKPSGGPQTGPFKIRAEAIQFEIDWIEDHLGQLAC